MKLKMLMQDKFIFLGVISAAYGIKGEVIIKTFNAKPEELPEMQIVDKEGREINLTFVRMHPKGGIVAKIEHCHTRTMAEKLAKTKLYCLRDSLPQTEDDEFYITDLINLKVLDEDNNHVGKILAIHNFGAGDIIEIEFANSGKKEMFPFTKEYFPTIEDEYIVLVQK